MTITCIYDSVLLTRCLNLIFNAFLLSMDFLSMTVEVLFIVLSLLWLQYPVNMNCSFWNCSSFITYCSLIYFLLQLQMWCSVFLNISFLWGEWGRWKNDIRFNLEYSHRDLIFQQCCQVPAEAVLSFVHVIGSQQAAYKMFVYVLL